MTEASPFGGDLTAADPTTALPVVELAGVSRTFGDGSPRPRAPRASTSTIWPGEWVSIVGPSGSGKSTLLNIVGLLDRQTAGTYRFDGVDVAELDDLGRAGLRGRRIGFVFQAFHLLPHRSVLENVMLAELYRGVPREWSPGAGASPRSNGSGSPTGRTSSRPSSRAASSSGPRSPRALMGDPASCSATSPPGTSTRRAPSALLDVFAQLSQDGLTLAVITHDEHVAEPGRPPVAHHRRRASAPRCRPPQTLVRGGDRVTGSAGATRRPAAVDARAPAGAERPGRRVPGQPARPARSRRAHRARHRRRRRRAGRHPRPVEDRGQPDRRPLRRARRHRHRRHPQGLARRAWSLDVLPWDAERAPGPAQRRGRPPARSPT